MPSTLHCVLLSGKYRLLPGLTEGFHPDGFQASKRLLTGGTRLENGPGVARRFFLFRSSTKPLAEESLKSGPVSV
jgi:hypothetical protein